ncbi:thioredoxin domain-containing protein [Alicyclobacillus herbarius]|nr:glycoside hydrolase family 9 protein [Alicyclobacillus herbarius]
MEAGFLYAVSEGGNFARRSIPNLLQCPEEQLNELWARPESDAAKTVRGWNETLRQAREERVRPDRDDKILTAWNGLMMAALAKAARVFDNGTFLGAAQRALLFLEQYSVDEAGRLCARFRDGERGQVGYVDDYAFFIWALLELYDATWDPIYLKKAVHWQRQMMQRLWDPDQGGFFLYGRDAEALIMRPKEIYDGATPSGNSVAALNLFRLGRLLADEEWIAAGRKFLEAFAGEVTRYPAGYTFYTMAFQYASQPSREIVILTDAPDVSAGKVGSEEARLLRELKTRFLPDTVVLIRPLHALGPWENLAPYLADYKPIEGKPTFYLCQNYACQAPTTDVNQVIQALDRRE